MHISCLMYQPRTPYQSYVYLRTMDAYLSLVNLISTGIWEWRCLKMNRHIKMPVSYKLLEVYLVAYNQVLTCKNARVFGNNSLIKTFHCVLVILNEILQKKSLLMENNVSHILYVRLVSSIPKEITAYFHFHTYLCT